MSRYCPSEMSTNHGDEEQFVRAHALLCVARNQILDAAKELRGYSGLTAPLRALAREVDDALSRVDGKYGASPTLDPSNPSRP